MTELVNVLNIVKKFVNLENENSKIQILDLLILILSKPIYFEYTAYVQSLKCRRGDDRNCKLNITK